jgi:hypothetical protein
VWTYGVGAASGEIRTSPSARPLHHPRRRRHAPAGARDRRQGRAAPVRPRLGARAHGALDGHPFRIVGVSREKGEQMVNMGPRDDEQVLLPYSTAQRLFTGTDHIDYVLYEPRTRDEGGRPSRGRGRCSPRTTTRRPASRRRSRSSTSPTPSASST